MDRLWRFSQTRICSRRPRLATALALGVATVSPALATPPAERQAELIHRLKHDCGSCHGMTLKGGLGPSLLPEALAGKSNDALVEVILYGLPGTPMPPWSFEIRQEEADWLVERMKEGL